MRKPYPYESDHEALEIQLVPDPLPNEIWQRLLSEWKESDGKLSLLEWIVLKDALRENGLLQALATGTGAPIRNGVIAKGPGSPPPEWEVLRRHGFVYLGKEGRRHCITGGPVLNPNLETYLGAPAKSWSWCLVSPLRQTGRESTYSPVSPSSIESLLKDLLEEAQLHGAADIHFERSASHLMIRMKTNTGTRELATIESGRALACMQLLKRWSNLSTAVNCLPQDGRMVIGEGQSELSYRVSHLSTVDGESLVLRPTQGRSKSLGLADLGAPDELQASLLETALLRPGLILCSGPTCSGKTTTLYALMQSLSTHHLKLMSIEDPVEHELPGVLQSNVRETVRWTFANALKAYLRQDPDVILVGELRDAASAETACQAGLTGHAVLATVHGLTAMSVLDRLSAWDLAHGMIAEAVRFVVHQEFKSRVCSPDFCWFMPTPAEVTAYLSGDGIPEAWKNNCSTDCPEQPGLNAGSGH